MNLVLRPYQSEAVADVEAAWRTNRSALVVMPTGTGKGDVGVELVSRAKRALWLTHRREMITDAAGRIWQVTGDPPDVEQAKEWAMSGAPHVVASVMTLQKDRRLTRFQRSRFDVVVVDECHHATAPSVRKIIDYFSGAKVVGFTATPRRADGVGLGAVFEVDAFVYPITKAFEDGWLVPWNMRREFVKSVHLEGIGVLGTDFDPVALDRMLSERDPVVDLVAGTLNLAGHLRTLVFCAGVHQGKLVTENLNGHRPGCARWVDGETPRHERDAMFKAYARGDFQFLVACQVPTEGWDEPGVQCISFMRPTLSGLLMAQMCGRGLRPLRKVGERGTIVDGLETPEARRAAIAGSAKPECLMLDWVGNTGRHDLATPMDVLAGDDPPEVRRRAERLLLKRPGLTVEKALEKARREDTARRKKAATRVRVETVGVRVDPLKKKAELAGDGNLESRPSPGHAKALSIAGFDPEQMTAAQGRLVFSCLLDCGGKANQWPRLGSLNDWERGQWVIWAREIRRQGGTPQLQAWGLRKKAQIEAFKETGPALYVALRATYAGRKKVIDRLALDECGGAQDAV